MSTESLTREILELLAIHREGGLSEEQQARLHELLKSNPDARRAFVQDQLMEAAFQLETPGNLEEVPTSSPKIVPYPSSSRARTSAVWRWAVAASIVFAIGLGLGGILKRPAAIAVASYEEPVDDGIALLTQSVDAVWKGNHQPQTGAILSAGKLQLEAGLAQIEFYSGACLILEGPVDLELVSANQAICRSGRLRALVPPQARGFSVTSPQFELVDLGTEFGMEVGVEGNSKVQVFDGEVELYPQGGGRARDKVHRLLGGAGLSWLSSGEKTDIPTDPSSFPSFDDIRSRTQLRSQQQYAAWQSWNRSLADDPRIAVRYDFESDRNTLRDSGSLQSHGTIIGCDRTNGRWVGKGALEFKRPSDRVRVVIPGTYDELTLTAWIRVDASPGRQQGLLLTDGYVEGRPHWQISPDGELRLGLRVPSTSKQLKATGYGSPVLFKPREIGVWNFIATVYDRREGMVRHFLNGREVSAEKIQFDQALQIGSADIGNWGIPFEKDNHPVRNFIGRMDEMTLWKVALKGEELLRMYQKTRP